MTDTEAVSTETPAPEMTIAKTADQTANASVGDVITYTYVVENTGNVTMNDVSISDVHSGSGTLSPFTPANVTSLAVGASTTFTATYTITQADIDAGAPITNTATANATPTSGTYTPATDDETVTADAGAPEIIFNKTASDTTNLAVGDIITYTYTAENTGNVTITNVSVSDVHNGSGSLSAITPASVATLNVGQTVTFTATYEVTQADVDAIAQARHIAAHALLGLQTLTDTRLSGEEKLVIRVFMPDAQHIVILDKKTQKPLATLTQVDPRGFFVAKLRRKKRFAYQLQVSSNGQVQVVEDAYAFCSTMKNAILGELDLHLLNEGNHQKPYRVLGARSASVTDNSNSIVEGTTFSVWAPN